MSSSTPPVTIGLPVYNGAAFLRTALDLLLSQTYRDFELLISDNASTDDTGAICQAFAARDLRIVYVRQPTNIGVVANFQYTLDRARGKYFMWAACDDWWDKEYVATLAELLDKTPESVIAFCRMHHVDMAGRVFRDYPNLPDLDISRPAARKALPFARTSFDAFMLQDAVHGKVNIIYGLIRREALVKADIWNRWGNYPWGQDLLAVASVLRHGNVVFTDRVLWKKTENPESASSLKRSHEPFRLFRSLRAVARTYLLYLRYIAGLWAVQGPMADALPIPLGRRVLFTVFEWLRMSGSFAKRSIRAAARRGREAATTQAT